MKKGWPKSAQIILFQIRSVTFEVAGSVTFEFPTNLGTSHGHANAALAAGVGAADYLATPAFGVSPPEIESFSSAGGVPIFLAPDGSTLTSPENRSNRHIWDILRRFTTA